MHNPFIRRKRREAEQQEAYRKVQQEAYRQAEEWAIAQTHRCPAQGALSTILRNPKGEPYPEGAIKVEKAVKEEGNIGNITLSKSKLRSPLVFTYRSPRYMVEWNQNAWEDLKHESMLYIRTPKLGYAKFTKRLRDEFYPRRLIRDSQLFL